MFIFNGPNRTIKINTINCTMSTMIHGQKWFMFDALDLYSSWKRWCVQGEGANFPPAFSIVGGEDIGDNLKVGSYIFMLVSNGWMGVPPDEDDIIISINGNLYPDIANYPVMKKNPLYTSTLLMRTSSLTQIVSVGSGLSNSQNNLLEQAAREAKLARQFQSNKAVITQNKKVVTIYDDDGITPLHIFHISDDKLSRSKQ